MSCVVVVQARMGSTRLPGKVMRPLEGAPMLARLLERLARCRLADRVVVATSDQPADAAVAELAAAQGFGVFRGSEDDVLARVHGAANEAQAETVVRVTADCPLIEPAVVDRCIAALHASGADYASNCHARSYPRGLDSEAMTFAALLAAHQEATAQPEREHVTPFIWRQPERFRLLDVVDSEDRSALRWTVDTPEDFELVRRIYDALYPDNPAFGYHDVLALLARHPEWNLLNQHVEQKEIEHGALRIAP